MLEESSAVQGVYSNQASNVSSFCLSFSSPSSLTALAQHRIKAGSLGDAFLTFDYTSGTQSRKKREKWVNVRAACSQRTQVHKEGRAFLALYV